MSTEIDDQVLDEKAELLITRNIRVKINKHLMADGKVPDDPEKLNFLLTNLRDMDKSALSRAKIKSDEKVATNTAETISIVTQVFQSLKGNKELPPEDISEIVRPADSAPVLPDGISTKTIIEGETAIGVITEDIDSFRKRMNS